MAVTNNAMLEEFKEIRRVSTPWCAIRTTDCMSTIFSLLRIKKKGVKVIETQSSSMDSDKLKKIANDLGWTFQKKDDLTFTLFNYKETLYIQIDGTEFGYISGTEKTQNIYKAKCRELFPGRSNTVEKDTSLFPACIWTCVSGIISPIKLNTGEVLSQETEIFASGDDAPFMMFKKALTLPPDSILFVILPDDTLLSNTFTIQAISDLRDEFKTNGRTLVLLGIDPKIPPFLQEDIPILDDPLPDKAELEIMISGFIEARNKELEVPVVINKDSISRAADACTGMTRFMAEEAIARKFKKSGIDVKGLNLIRRSSIESASNNAIVFGTETWDFNKIGGLDGFRSYVTKVFNGPKRPKVVVLIDEIDKDITAASAGQVADNTGTSQNILKKLLKAINDNRWLALLAFGVSGAGKTLSAICTANEFEVEFLEFNVGDTKDSLVGASEKNMNRCIDTIKTIGGENVLLIATANRKDTLPPELLSRFRKKWFWDVPSEEEKKRIWEIQMERFGLEKQAIPISEHWVGRDIAACCEESWTTNSSLVEESKQITPSAMEVIERLRTEAEINGYISASTGKKYKKPEERKTMRKISGNN